MHKTDRPRFGAHMSAAGGLENAFYAGRDVGCQCLQVFVKNQRQWKARPLGDEHVQAFRKAKSATRLSPVVAHASYLLNLAAPESSIRKQSIAALIDETKRCETLGIDAVIFHPGAHKDGTLKEGIQNIAGSLDQVQRSCRGFKTKILLEVTAGQGTAIGHRFDQIQHVLEQVKDPDALGVCLDTCHLFAAGYDFRKPEGYQAMIDEMQATFGTKNVRCIHTNDSKKACGSRVDRHEHIGKGKIGKSGFVNFVNDHRWRNVPFILETPKGTDGRGTDLDTANLRKLRRYCRPDQRR